MTSCSGLGCCGDTSAQALPSQPAVDDIETCSGKVCDEECIKAAAVLECQSACTDHDPTTQSGKTAIGNACSEHLRAAFDKYTILLEQARCICRRVIKEQKLKCCSDDDLSARPGRSSLSTAKGENVLRQRKNLPCFDKRIIPQEASDGYNASGMSSSCCSPAQSEFTAIQPCGEGDAKQPTCCIIPSLEPALARNEHNQDTLKQVSCCAPVQVITKPAPCGGAKMSTFCHAAAATAGKDCQSTCCDIKSSEALSGCIGNDLERGSNHDHVVFSVAGMDCTGCESIVHKALRKVPGVHHLEVNFVTATASCDIDPAVTTVDEVTRIMQRTTNYKLSRFEDKDQFLDIIVSPAVLDASLEFHGINGIKRLSKTTVRLRYDAIAIGARSVLQRFPGATLAPPSQALKDNGGSNHVRKSLLYTLTATAFTVPVLVLTWGLTQVSDHTKKISSLALATFVQAIALPVFYSPALSALITSHVIEMDMLVVISITAAYVYSVVAFSIEMSGRTLDTGPFFETSTLLITLVLLGRLIAAYARNRAIASVSLHSLQTNVATLVDKEGATTAIDARLLEFNDMIIIQPKSQIVTDGTIIAGASELDESMISGESLPVAKAVGDVVTAGTMNGNGSLTVQVTRLPGRNTITDIAKLVGQAHSSKPKVQDVADRVAGCFIPVVVAISLLVTIIWVAIGVALMHKSVGAAIGSAITYGIAVLAISCPCALGLAVPMVLVVTGGQAARSGIVIKTAGAIERGYKVTDMIFDKTGTLTEHNLKIEMQVYPEQNILSRERTLGLVKAVVRDNTHPVSKAISTYLHAQPSAEVKMSEVQALPGLGITCESNAVHYSAGSAELANVSEHALVGRMTAQGLTLFCVASGGQLLAVYGLRTNVRAEAKAVMTALHNRNINVHILSGDTQQSVNVLALELGVPADQAHGRRAPAQKQEYVKKLMHGNKTVLFCGDGTNDAIAITQADIGVQIAPTASDVTRATADVVLMSNDLAGILQLLDITRAAFTRICFNFFWAALYNVFAVLLASGAFVRFRIEPAYAGLGEIVSVLPVVLMALTIGRPERIITA